MTAVLPRIVPMALLAFCVGAGHAHAPAGHPSTPNTPAAGVHLRTAQLLEARQQRILTLRQTITATPLPRERFRSTPRATSGDNNTVVDRNDSIVNQNSSTVDAAPPPGVLAVGPVTDAVAHICGPNVTVCGIWWPTAVTDRVQYQNCVRQNSGSNDLDFGTSPAEYCSALYTGDCEGVGPGSDLSELCSLVPGVAAQWSREYGFSKFVTHGDCGYYKTVDVSEHNVLGFQLQQPERPGDQAAAAPARDALSKPALKICTGRLYLKILQ